MTVEFGRPEAFGLLILLPLLVLVQLMSRVYLPKGRRLLVLGLRGLQIVALVSAIAEPQLLLPAHRVSTVFLVDGSASVSPPARQQATGWVRQALKAMGARDRGAVVVFGREAVVER